MNSTESTQQKKNDNIQEVYAKMRGEVRSLSDAYKLAYGEDYLAKQEREIQEERKN